jgi:hypothetical protein
VAPGASGRSARRGIEATVRRGGSARLSGPQKRRARPSAARLLCSRRSSDLSAGTDAARYCFRTDSSSAKAAVQRQRRGCFGRRATVPGAGSSSLRLGDRGSRSSAAPSGWVRRKACGGHPSSWSTKCKRHRPQADGGGSGPRHFDGSAAGVAPPLRLARRRGHHASARATALLNRAADHSRQ